MFDLMFEICKMYNIYVTLRLPWLRVLVGRNSDEWFPAGVGGVASFQPHQCIFHVHILSTSGASRMAQCPGRALPLYAHTGREAKNGTVPPGWVSCCHVNHYTPN